MVLNADLWWWWCSTSVSWWWLIKSRCDDDESACRKPLPIDDVAKFRVPMCSLQWIYCNVIGRQWTNGFGEFNFAFASLYIRTRQGCRGLSESRLLTGFCRFRKMLPVSWWWKPVGFLLAASKCIFLGHGLFCFYFIVMKNLMTSGTVLIKSFVTQLH